MGEDMIKEKVTPSGRPAEVNPINKGIEEHEQNGVTVPSRAATQLAPIPRIDLISSYYAPVENSFEYRR
jgi:hypothetical protein